MASTLALSLPAIFAALLPAAKAGAACEDYYFQLGQQGATYTYLSTSGGQTQEITANMSYQQGAWKTISIYDEEGPVQAGSSFKVLCTGSHVIAELKHSVSSTASAQTVTTNGTGQFQITLNGSPSVPVTILVDITRVILPSNDAVGTVILSSSSFNVTGRSLLTNEQKTYVVEPGQATPIISVSGKATLTSVGSINVTTTVKASIADCSDPLRDAIVEIKNPDDDEEDPDDEPCPAGEPSSDEGVALHIRSTTGNVWTRVLIFRTLANEEVELDFELRYDSQRAAQNGPLGYGWTHSYNRRLTAGAGGSLGRCQPTVYWSANGRRNAFVPDLFGGACGGAQNGSYQRPIGRALDLIWPDDSSISPPKIMSHTGHTSTFDTNGRLQHYSDRRGRLTYFSYDSGGRLTKIVSPHGRVVTFSYQGSSPQIYQITDPNNRSTTFEYYSNGDLKKITDDSQHSVQYEYDGSHRITKETLKNGLVFTASYGTTNAIRDSQPVIVAEITPSSGLSLPASRDLTIAPGVLTYVDSCNRSWSIERDNLGRIREKQASNGAKQKVAYGVGPAAFGNRNRIIRRTNEMGYITDYQWTENHAIQEKKDAENNVTQQSYHGTFADLVTKRIEPGGVDGGKGCWEYQYDDATGDLLSITDPVRESPDKKTQFTYETHSPTQGLPSGISALPNRIKKITQTDQNDHVTIREYDLKGNREKITRGYGILDLVTTYEYDNMGRRTRETVSRPGESSVVTTWTYDAMGRELTMTKDPGGLNLVTAREYDGHGNLTLLTDARGKKTKFEYDLRNRLKKKIQGYGELNITTVIEYDCYGNVQKLTDPNLHETTFGYNPQNQLTSITDAEGYRTSLARDAAGRLRRMDRGLTPGPNAATAYSELYTYDKIGRVVGKTVEPGGLSLTTTIDYLPSGSCSCSPATADAALPYKITDPATRVTFFGYDNANRRTKIVRKVGDQNSDPNGDTNDAITQIEYDPEGNVTKIIGPETEQTIYGYDAADRRTRKKVFYIPSNDTTFYETSYSYDADDNLRGVVLPNGNIQTISYDLANRQIAVNDSVGAVVMYSYDQGDNVIREADGIGRTTRYDYDAVDRVVKVFDPIVESPDLFTEITYDDVGNRIQVTDKNGIKTRHAYDKLDRLVRTTEDYQTSPPQDSLTYNTITTYSYNGAVQTAISDHNGNTTTYGYDAALRLTSTTYPSPGGQVIHTYTAAGKLYTRIDQRGIVTTYTYDDLHQLTGRSYSTGPSETFAFDRSGRIKLANNAVANLAFTYDRAGRPDTGSQAYVSDSASYTLDHDWVIAATSQHKITYPGAGGRLVTQYLDARARLKDVVGGTFIGGSWGFDAADQRTYAFTPNMRIDQFTYDADGRLANIDYQSYGGTAYPITEFSTAYGYDAVGNRKFMRRSGLAPEDRSEHYDYDGRHRLKQMDRGILSTSGDQITTQLQDGVLAGKQEWSNLDRRGNWNEYKETINAALTTQTRSANGVNEYTSIDPDGPPSGAPCSAGCAYAVIPSYDAAGNLTTDPLAKSAGDTTPAGQWYKYDEESRVIEIRKTSSTGQLLLQFKYDAMGRRIETIEYMDASNGTVLSTPRHTRHVFEGLQTIQEYTCSFSGSTCSSSWTLAREFIWGDAKRFPEPVAMIDYTGPGFSCTSPSTGCAYHFLRDALGSVVGLTDDTGKLLERYSYDPYGKPYIEGWIDRPAPGLSSFQGPGAASVYGNPFLWTGQRHDAAVGLYHFNYRSHSLTLGTWLQRDPVGYTVGVNLYQFVGGNPIIWRDPLGLIPDIVIGRIEPGDDLGHTWIEYPGGSMGWWPVASGDWFQVNITGVPGQVKSPDPHQGHNTDKTWKAESSGKPIEYGPAKGKTADEATDEEIIEALKEAAKQWAKDADDKWACWFDNCRDFAEDVIGGAGLKFGPEIGPRNGPETKTDKKDGDDKNDGKLPKKPNNDETDPCGPPAE